MPILRPEPSCYPDHLLDEPAAAAPGERCWWVLYTKARQEKALARELLGRQIPFYLPQVAKTVLLRGKRVASYHPMFGGYLFLYAAETERIQSLKTNRVSRVLEVKDQDRLLFDLRQVRHLILSGAPVTIESMITPGDRVRVRGGPLAGLEGTVLLRRGKTRLLVSIDFLKQGASVEIDDFLLERL